MAMMVVVAAHDCVHGGDPTAAAALRQAEARGVIGAGARLGGEAGLSLERRFIYGLTDLKVTTLTSAQSFKHRTLLLLLNVEY